MVQRAIPLLLLALLAACGEKPVAPALPAEKPLEPGTFQLNLSGDTVRRMSGRATLQTRPDRPGYLLQLEQVDDTRDVIRLVFEIPPAALAPGRYLLRRLPEETDPRGAAMFFHGSGSSPVMDFSFVVTSGLLTLSTVTARSVDGALDLIAESSFNARDRRTLRFFARGRFAAAR